MNASTSERSEFSNMALRDNRAYFKIAHDLIALGESYIGQLDVKGNEGLDVVRCCLLARLFSGLGALCLLAARDYYTEALGQQRGLMEALARLTALCKKPALFDEYLMQDSINRLKVLKDLQKFREDWNEDIPREPSDDEVARSIADIDKEIETYNTTHSRKLRDIKSFEWAAAGEVVHLFYGYYPIASQALHHSPRDLERRLILSGEDVVGISVGPEEGDIAHLLLSSCKFVFVGLQWFAQATERELPTQVDELYTKFNETYEQKAGAEISQSS
jgi:hypothetical protein